MLFKLHILLMFYSSFSLLIGFGKSDSANGLQPFGVITDEWNNVSGVCHNMRVYWRCIQANKESAAYQSFCVESYKTAEIINSDRTTCSAHDGYLTCSQKSGFASKGTAFWGTEEWKILVTDSPAFKDFGKSVPSNGISESTADDFLTQASYLNISRNYFIQLTMEEQGVWELESGESESTSVIITGDIITIKNFHEIRDKDKKAAWNVNVTFNNWTKYNKGDDATKKEGCTSFEVGHNPHRPESQGAGQSEIICYKKSDNKLCHRQWHNGMRQANCMIKYNIKFNERYSRNSTYMGVDKATITYTPEIDNFGTQYSIKRKEYPGVKLNANSMHNC